MLALSKFRDYKLKSAHAGSAIAKERAAERALKKVLDNSAMNANEPNEDERAELRKLAIRAMYDRMRSVRKSLRASGARTNLVESIPDDA